MHVYSVSERQKPQQAYSSTTTHTMRIALLGLTLLAGALAQTPTSSSIPPPPANSVGCVLHGDHYHCDGPASTSASSTVSGIPPPPTESTGCTLHIDHYHCTGRVDGASSSSSSSAHGDEHDDEHSSAHDDDGPCIIHVGHT